MLTGRLQSPCTLSSFLSSTACMWCSDAINALRRRSCAHAAHPCRPVAPLAVDLPGVLAAW